MYKYNFFCFACSVLGAFIAFIIKDTMLSVLLLVLALFNYVLYEHGKKNSSSE